MKKITVLLLACLVMALAFSACSRDDEETPTPTPQPSANDGEAPAPTPPADPDNNDDVAPEAPAQTGLHAPQDFGGRTIRIAGWWETLLPGTVDPEEPDPATATDYFMSRLRWDNARRIEQDFNISYDEIVVPYEDLLPQLTASVLAGDPIADIYLLPGYGILTGFVGDLITPWSQVNLPGSDLLGSQTWIAPTVVHEGEIWSAMQNSGLSNANALGVNLDLINATGAPNPVDLFNAGNWNWDTMLEVMRMTTRDTTGDGLNDQFGLSGDWGTIVNSLLGANSGNTVTADLMYGWDQPRVMEVFDFVEVIARERLWYYDRYGESELSGWARNHNSFLSGNAALFMISTWILPTNADDMPFNFAIVPYPAGPSNDDGSTYLAPWQQGWTLPMGTADPHQVLVVFEELFTWPGMDEPTLLRDENAGWVRGRMMTEEDVQRKMMIGDNIRTDIGLTVPEYSWVIGSFVAAFWNQTGTVAQVAEEQRQVSQERLDRFFPR